MKAKLLGILVPCAAPFVKIIEHNQLIFHKKYWELCAMTNHQQGYATLNNEYDNYFLCVTTSYLIVAIE